MIATSDIKVRVDGASWTLIRWPNPVIRLSQRGHKVLILRHHKRPARETQYLLMNTISIINQDLLSRSSTSRQLQPGILTNLVDYILN